MGKRDEEKKGEVTNCVTSCLATTDEAKISGYLCTEIRLMMWFHTASVLHMLVILLSIIQS